MSFSRTITWPLALALCALGASTGVAQTQDAKGSADAKTAAATAAKEKARKGGGATSVQRLIEQLNAQRDNMIAAHEDLAKQLKQATEEKKKEIREKMQAQMKAFEEQQAALHKQIRDEQRKQRQNAGPKR